MAMKKALAIVALLLLPITKGWRESHFGFSGFF
jgi:hypothetical protein